MCIVFIFRHALTKVVNKSYMRMHKAFLILIGDQSFFFSVKAKHFYSVSPDPHCRMRVRQVGLCAKLEHS